MTADNEIHFEGIDGLHLMADFPDIPFFFRGFASKIFLYAISLSLQLRLFIANSVPMAYKSSPIWKRGGGDIL